MSWLMKISLYSPKLSRSSQAATSSVPHFWTTKVKSKTPLISTCSNALQAKVRPKRVEDRVELPCQQKERLKVVFPQKKGFHFTCRLQVSNKCEKVSMQSWGSLLCSRAFSFTPVSSIKLSKWIYFNRCTFNHVRISNTRSKFVLLLLTAIYQL